MKIYIALSFNENGMENVLVSEVEDKVMSLKAADFENCDALFIEVWEDGEKIDDFRLQETDSPQ